MTGFRYWVFKKRFEFGEDNEYWNREWFQKLRLEILDFSKRIGFNKVIYYEDQCAECYIENKFSSPNNELMDYIISKQYIVDYCKRENENPKVTQKWMDETVLIDVPDYIQNNKYLPEDKYAGILIDDFRDLR